jgi:hypothetical protein
VILLLLWSDTWIVSEKLSALGAESCSSSWKSKSEAAFKFMSERPVPQHLKLNITYQWNPYILRHSSPRSVHKQTTVCMSDSQGHRNFDTTTFRLHYLRNLVYSDQGRSDHINRSGQLPLWKTNNKAFCLHFVVQCYSVHYNTAEQMHLQPAAASQALLASCLGLTLAASAWLILSDRFRYVPVYGARLNHKRRLTLYFLFSSC